MSTTELQKRLMEKIEKTSNYELLEEAYRLLASEAEDNDIYEINEAQRQAIIEARQQVESGEYQIQVNKD